ncbi:hypothetical protein [Sphingomonas sp. Leaf25]|uniref:hypothetical protein n=1 Tax=Sphingomonas sp. Leaf25 TaxID=1735692 RepID=UPI0006F32BF4|nr:hypothetical protein [Sphingomonas sp. Leaf25]KQM98286.1 hypothetical protein ASE78_08580 [Sphingomonas sp. Leaf25]
MTFVSKAALAALFGLGATLAITPSADAQRKKKEEAPAAPQIQISEAFRTAALAADAAIKAKDFATADQQLAAAQAAATAGNVDEAYFLAQLKVSAAQAKNDRPALATAIDQLLASPKLDAGAKGELYYNRGILALDAKQNAVAIQNFERARAAGYNNPDLDLRLAQLNIQGGNVDQGLASIDKVIAARKASGQPVPPNWYDYAISTLYKANRSAEASQWARRQLTEYPTQANWRKVLILFRDRADNKGATLGNQARVDVLRLMRETKSLADQNDYREYVQTTQDIGLPYETVAVIDEGRATGKIPASATIFTGLKTTAQGQIRTDGPVTGLETRAKSAANGRAAAAAGNVYLANNNNAKAVELYQLALSKGGVDADEVNTRIGIAHARAGQSAEAKAAFAKVTNGPRGEIANFWTLYVDQPRIVASTPVVGNN